MKRRWAIFFTGIIVAFVGSYIWLVNRPRSGVEPMSGNETVLGWIGLATAVIGLATSLVTLVATFRVKK